MAHNEKIRTVIGADETPQPVEILEKAIVDIAAAMKKLQKSRLEDEVIARLIAWKSGVSIIDVRKVLENMADLEALLLKPRKK